MKVALVGPYPVDAAYIPGGVAAVTYYVVQGLRQWPDIDLHVVTTTKTLATNTLLKDGNLTIRYTSEPRYRVVPNLLANIGRIKAELKRIDPDVVHSESSVGTLAGAAAGYPTIHTIHGIPHEEVRFAPTLYRKVAVFVEGLLAKRAVSRAQCCIATSGYAVRAYTPCNGVKMHQIHNPIEDRFFAMNCPVTDGKLLHASYISRLKNILGLVKAFELVRQRDSNPRLFICGKAVDAKYKALVEDYVKSHNLQDAVNLLGFISQEELGRHFDEAALICLFSRQESAPMAIAQAMCAGKPVVASAVGGTPDLVLDGETGFLVGDDDQPAFAEKVLRLLSDPVLRRTMGARAREVAEERFRKEVVAAKTIEVYSEVLKA